MIEINYGAILFSFFASSCIYLSIAHTMSEINARIGDTRFTKKASQEIREWNRYFEAGIRRLRVQECCGRLRDAVEEHSIRFGGGTVRKKSTGSAVGEAEAGLVKGK
jgi:hypothetical protein